MKQGRQLRVECLTIEEMFINGQINSDVSRVPEVESAPDSFLITYPQAAGYPQELSTGRGWGGGLSTGRRTGPVGLKFYQCMYNTPQQKIYAKVKCPNLYTYF
jgi:hypothetical protein